MLILRLAWRDLRGVSGGLRILVTALVLAVAAIAAVGSIADGLLADARGSARQAVGGDLAFRLFHRQPTAAERALLAGFGDLAEVAELRVRAARPDGEAAALVELKAIDAAYPLFGELVIDPPVAVAAALGRDAAGIWGAVVDADLLAALDLAPGQRLRLGSIEVEIRARLVAEPDRALRTFALGPRVLVALPALAASGLAEAGSTLYWYSRLRLADGLQSGAVVAAVESRFPNAGWRIVDAADGIPGIERSIAIGRALVLSLGLAVLVIGGVGIGGAVTAHLDRRTPTIAVLGTLGATGRQITAIYLVQLLLAAGTATLAGLALGAIAAFALRALGLLPVLADSGPAALQPGTLGLAAAMGLVTTLLFAWYPLRRATAASPARLFRALVAGAEARQATRRRRLAAAGSWLVVATLAGLLGGLVVLASGLPVASLAVLAALLATAALLAAWARLVTAAVRRWRPALRLAPHTRLALAQLAGPGAPTHGAVTALGLGLAALIAVLSLQTVAARHLAATLPASAPDLVLINLDPRDGEALQRLAAETAAIARWRLAPFLHARVTHLDGVAVAERQVPRDLAWVIRGDRGLSWPWAGDPAAQRPPPAATDPARASLAADLAPRLGLAVGDRLTLDLQGRPLEVTVATLHEVDWTRLDLDFPILLAPPAEPPPHRLVAALWLDDGTTAAVVEALGRRFPDAPAIRVPEVLDSLGRLVDGLAAALGLATAVTLAAAGLVLAGGIAAGYRRRRLAGTILWTQGVPRREVARAAALELALVGLAAALPAGLLGLLAARLVAERLAPGLWQLDPLVPLGAGLAAVLVLAALGYALPLRRPGGRSLPD